MDPREELQALRRLAELEARAGGKSDAKPGNTGKDVLGGLVRGAGSIGATIVDAARNIGDSVLSAVPDNMRPGVTAGLKDAPRGKEIRQGMDDGLRALGADPDSLAFQGGKLTSEVLGTLGAGGAVANVVRPAAPVLSKAISSGGFNAPGANLLTRIAGGAVSGGATAGLVDPEQAKAGAVIGGALPVVAKGAGAAGNYINQKFEGGARRLMQSAIKPTIAQLKSGDADTAVNVLLERGISPNQAGVNKLRDLLDSLDDQVTTSIANSSATVDKQNVLNRLAGTRAQFGNQVSPTADLNAIQAVADDFLANPAVPLAIPVQQAQELKRGTYKVLAKKYDKVGSAEVEAQKALARGLKEEVAAAVPGVQGLNDEMSKLITTLDVAERRALMEMNKNPMGLAALAQSPASWAAFMADRSSAFKAIAARMLNASSGGAGSALQALGNSTGNPLIRNALVRTPVTSSEGTP